MSNFLLIFFFYLLVNFLCVKAFYFLSFYSGFTFYKDFVTNIHESSTDQDNDKSLRLSIPDQTTNRLKHLNTKEVERKGSKINVK